MSNASFSREDEAHVFGTDEEKKVSLTDVAFNLRNYERPGALPTRSEIVDILHEHERRSLPTEAAARKAVPIASGVLDYFPDALAEIARVSKAGNDQHNAGQPLHWARGKSMDQADCLIRHFLERGTVDTDTLRHSAKMAWRALALLQLELEAAGAPVARGAREA